VRHTAIKKSILYILIIIFVIYFSFTLFKSSETSAPKDYKSAVKLDIPPGYKNLSANLKHDTADLKAVADVFLKSLENATQTKLAVKYAKDGQILIYLLNSADNSIRKRQINPSGTLLEYTWRGMPRQRLEYARMHNTLDVPGSDAAEVKNLYH